MVSLKPKSPDGATSIGKAGCLGCAGLVVLIIAIVTGMSLLDHLRLNKRGWGVVSSRGATRFAYMSPEVLSDHDEIARALGEMVPAIGAVEVHIFDRRAVVPSSFPLSDQALLSLRAQYQRNPTTGLEEFLFLTVSDSTTSPPELESMPVPIRPLRPGG